MVGDELTCLECCEELVDATPGEVHRREDPSQQRVCGLLVERVDRGEAEAAVAGHLGRHALLDLGDIVFGKERCVVRMRVCIDEARGDDELGAVKGLDIGS